MHIALIIHMTQPRPVPSGCIDTTPASLWDVLWKIDQTGEMSMPTEVKLDYKKIRFWKSYFNDDNHRPGLPHEFWKVYWRMFPRGHPEDQTKQQYVTKDEWDDSKHGYFHSNGSLIFKHPDGTVYLKGVTGADEFH